MEPLSERQKVVRLLNRFGMGASEAEVDWYGRDGFRGAVDRLLDWSSVPEAPQPEIGDITDQPARFNPRFAQTYWAQRLLTTRRPLLEKLTLYWHNHFATSAQKVDSGYALHSQNAIFRDLAGGSFNLMLKAVSTDPAMLYWLDGFENVKGRANENFAREVMELFTLGEGQGYTEKDIQEASRAFTGWTIGVGRRALGPGTTSLPKARTEFVYALDRHDDGMKTLLGRTGAFTGFDVLDALCEHPQMPRFVAGRMWTWFHGSRPSPERLERLARGFRQSGLNIRSLVKELMLAEEAYAPDAQAVKTPVDVVFAAARQIGLAQTTEAQIGQARESIEFDQQNRINRRLAQSLNAARQLSQASALMGMDLYYPPDVAGWPTGLAWISTNTLTERKRFADRLFNPGLPGRGGFTQMPLASLATYNDTGFVDRLSGMFQAEPSTEGRRAMVEAASAIPRNPARPTSVFTAARSVAGLLFSSPEFQFQ